ncbi:aldose 1-epimerase family protein [Marinilactibacillus psychrotolerans]|uniref:aldose 1-epimerase family protein n=1 Tax=Marinilactibacillus psychrotolerans TaxID=191770 RepID=UPI0038848D6B
MGDLKQIAGIKDYTFNEGKAKHVRALELYSSGGLELTVLPDRGMDIVSLKYKGINISYLSKTGIVSPEYFSEDGVKGFFKNFYAGFLTTGGLSYMGAPSCVDGRKLGLHGVISNTPAYNVCYTDNYFKEDSLVVTGKVKEAEVFGNHLILTRKIKYDKKKSTIYIHDNIKNLNYEKSSFMILYHINFGYPFLSPDLNINIPSKKVISRDKNSVIEKYSTISEPSPHKKEEVFFHKMNPDKNDTVKITLKNTKLKIGIEITYLYKDLPYLTQWKSMKSSEYVLGIEPGNYNVLGKRDAIEKNKLTYLKPLEEKNIKLKIRFFDI